MTNFNIEYWLCVLRLRWLKGLRYDTLDPLNARATVWTAHPGGIKIEWFMSFNINPWRSIKTNFRQHELLYVIRLVITYQPLNYNINTIAVRWHRDFVREWIWWRKGGERVLRKIKTGKGYSRRRERKQLERERGMGGEEDRLIEGIINIMNNLFYYLTFLWLSIQMNKISDPANQEVLIRLTLMMTMSIYKVSITIESKCITFELCWILCSPLSCMKSSEMNTLMQTCDKFVLEMLNTSQYLYYIHRSFFVMSIVCFQKRMQTKGMPLW